MIKFGTSDVHIFLTVESHKVWNWCVIFNRNAASRGPGATADPLVTGCCVAGTHITNSLENCYTCII